MKRGFGRLKNEYGLTPLRHARRASIAATVIALGPFGLWALVTVVIL